MYQSLLCVESVLVGRCIVPIRNLTKKEELILGNLKNKMIKI